MSEPRDFLRKAIEQNGLDAELIFKALGDTLELGLVDWGDHRDLIRNILSDPSAQDIYTLVSNSDVILKPLRDWVTVERSWNLYKRDSISKREWAEREDRCYQVYIFIMTIKLH